MASGEKWSATPPSSASTKTSALYGGAFKVTEGLIDRFGPERVVINTPILSLTLASARA